jgi:hypothetical protein
MADESALTPPEKFIADRLRCKVGAAKHHIVDAAKAAAVLPPDVLARCGMREAVAVLEKELANLRLQVLGTIREAPANG